MEAPPPPPFNGSRLAERTHPDTASLSSLGQAVTTSTSNALHVTVILGTGCHNFNIQCSPRHCHPWDRLSQLQHPMPLHVTVILGTLCHNFNSQCSPSRYNSMELQLNDEHVEQRHCSFQKGRMTMMISISKNMDRSSNFTLKDIVMSSDDYKRRYNCRLAP